MATMKDVAKKAGVSTYTVSNVLNNLSYLKEETRQKVLDAIEELDYKPNYAGKLLRYTEYAKYWCITSSSDW